MKSVETWCLENYGESPLMLVEWASQGDVKEQLIQLSRSIVVLSFLGDLSESKDIDILTIHIKDWNHATLKAQKLAGDFILLEHGETSITLTAGEGNDPPKLVAQITEWMMQMIGEQHPNKENKRRIATLQREKEAVKRLLSQVDFERVKVEIESQKKKLDRVEEGF